MLARLSQSRWPLLAGLLLSFSGDIKQERCLHAVWLRCATRVEGRGGKAGRSGLAVFVGRLVRTREVDARAAEACLDPSSDRRDQYRCAGDRLRFEVSRAWKGVTRSRITVLGGFSNCDYVFDPDRTYLVYAVGVGRPVATICG